jgi:hypothetical protein
MLQVANVMSEHRKDKCRMVQAEVPEYFRELEPRLRQYVSPTDCTSILTNTDQDLSNCHSREEN